MGREIQISYSVAQIKKFALQEFDQEIVEKQLYYHNRAHIQNVERRSHHILQVVIEAMETFDPRMKELLDLSVVAHDMVQIFMPQNQPHSPRRRKAGVSEREAIRQLLQYIQDVNEQLPACDRLTEDDIAIVRDAIAATICSYDPTEQAIFQPMLADPNLAIVARILALADINALGIDGIELYNEEGSLLFLEENLDIIPLILQGKIYELDKALHDNVRQRLLNRCRFQVSFARSRLARLPQELIGFPETAIPKLRQQVFRHLNLEIIEKVAALTPTHQDATLVELLQFFQFENYLNR